MVLFDRFGRDGGGRLGAVGLLDVGAGGGDGSPGLAAGGTEGDGCAGQQRRDNRLNDSFLFVGCHHVGVVLKIVHYLEPCLFAGGLFGEETGGEALFVGSADEDAALAVFGAASAVKTDAGAVGHLLQHRQQSTEFGAHRNGYFVSQRRDEELGIFQGVADGFEPFTGRSGAFVEIGRHAAQLAVHGFVNLVISDQFVVHIVVVF